MLKLSLIEGEKKCPFRCKWAAAPGTEGGASSVCVCVCVCVC